MYDLPLKGTHNEQPRPRGGYPNTAKPEKSPGRKIRKARERLEARKESYAATINRRKHGSSGGAFRMPGSLKCK